jgi:outer membrane protein assembly factor BamA
MWKFVISFSILIFAIRLNAQQINYEQVYIDSILIQGNKKTKDKIILRELKFEVGDSILISQLSEVLEKNQKYVLNTGLFTWGKINIKSWDARTNRITLLIDLSEAWYIWPFPIFELADRNFNVWWDEFNASLSRVNYGVRLNHHNTTGNKDPLKLILQGGFTQKYELNYTLPPLNKNQTFGIIADLFYAKNREIGYITLDNVLQFERRENEFPEQRIRAGFSFIFRPKFRSYHFAKIEFQHNIISDYVANDLNSDFFLNARTKQLFFYLRYEYVHENRDIIPYPLNGNFLSLVLEKEGLGIFDDINGFYFSSKFAQYFSFGKKWSTEFILKGRLALFREKQPYNRYKALGYFQDYLRGYERYVIDGLDYVYFKSSLRYEFINKRVNLGKLMPIKALRLMPLRLYLTLNNDLGYANDPYFFETNPFTNRMLWGWGVGFDINISFGSTIQIEYSINHLWEKGLFLHYKLNI